MDKTVEVLMDNIVVDDGPQAEEVSAEELNSTLKDGEQVENHGDDSQPEQKAAEKPHSDRSSQIRAALKSQRESIFRDLGMSEAEVRDLIREAKAAQMNKEDPDISVKAAKEILKARESAQPDRQKEFADAIATLRDDGWDDAELQALVTDKTVLEDIRGGKTLRQAARAYEKRQNAPAAPTRKRAVPTVRGSSGGAGGDTNAEMIANMSDAEFRQYKERIHALQMQGKYVSI